MPVSPALTAELKKVVLWMEDDLRERIEQQAHVKDIWVREHAEAVERERTAMSWQAWRDDRVTQAAVAWVLTTVFIRFCEDNRLLQPVWISGPEARRQEALDAELTYFRVHPEHTSREWLEHAIVHLRKVDATRSLVESHSPLWTVSPSGRASQRLVNFWRETGEDGSLVWDFADSELSTRFLGDLYQDLSDYAKKTYALLQTPEFIEEFILDQTMEPALAERPLEGFTLIDPTCGSGHFLLGAFARLNDRWATHAPGLNVRARVAEALDAIHGVDLNPFAVAIARFRLIVAALQACGEASLETAPDFPLNLAAGDSLLHGQHQASFDFDGHDFDSELSGFGYTSEDLALLRKILLPGRYDVVVGNPPYITVKDRTLNATYRALYPTCHRTYALTVPFMERFFQLAKASQGDQPAGWTGQITSNSFMKREFGAPLIEKFLSRRDLRLIVDTSGAYIPGHGTPTVIIVGRNQTPIEPTIRAVLGIRGEPGQPADPATGRVWSSIVDHIEEREFEGTYISVTDTYRTALGTHPWSLAGGAAAGLLATVNGRRERLRARATRIGFYGDSHADEAFFLPPHVMERYCIDQAIWKVASRGDSVRDWRALFGEGALLPRSRTRVESTEVALGRGLTLYWPLRTELWSRGTFGGGTYQSDGRDWLDWHQLPADLTANASTIAFAFVATHNHFVLDRGGKVFNRSAPVIKLPADATEDDHLALLGVLNSSTACFWLKQNSHNKGNGGIGGGIGDEDWEPRYEFTGTTLKDFPLPAELPLVRGRSLDQLAQAKARCFEAAIPCDGISTADGLDRAHKETASLTGQLVAQQEELDWEVYALYGITDEPLIYTNDDLPEVVLGERAFEIALARTMAAGEEETAWFTRHRSTPITEIPTHWPAAYRELVQRRLDLIESDKFIRLLEKPEHKRRWASEPWEKQVERALRGWLLDRLEDRKYWFDSQDRPVPTSIGQLADQVSRDADLVSVLELWSGAKDQGVAKTLTALLADEAVPYLAAYRLKDSGLRKREAWERTWELQRREDAGEHIKDIPVPPKYTSGDFRKQTWWHHRGKLDVPKERFILYPDASRDTDPTLLIGWAGWDHAQQAIALAMIIDERTAEGAADSTLVPLVAGLAELQPWIAQWHNEVDPLFGVNMADFCAEQLRERAARLGQTIDQVRAWRPAAPRRGRKARS